MRSSPMPLVPPPMGKHLMPALADAPNDLDVETLDGLDRDKLSDLAVCPFMLNNQHFDPIPGFYVVVKLSGKEVWCVSQLRADRAKLLGLFNELVFDSAEAAQVRAQERRAAVGPAPQRL